MIQRVILIFRESLSTPFLSMVVALAIAAAVTTAGTFYITGKNFNHYINRRFASSLPPNTIKVIPKEGKTVLFFKFQDSSVKQLDEKSLRAIRRLKGVKDVVPFLALKIPMQARISLFSLSYRSDLMSIGIPYRYLKKDISREFRSLWKKPDLEKRIPVILPRAILNIYNQGMAEANNLPKLSEQSVIGLNFLLLFGRSSLKQLEDYSRTTAVIAGLTEEVNNLALIIPYRAALYYNKKYIENYRPRYLSLFVRSRDHASLLRVSKRIRAMGFTVEVKKGLSKQIVDLKRRVARVIDSLMLLIIVISAIAVGFSTMIATMERLDYYRIMRVVGASRPFIAVSILLKYFLLGCLGTGTGLLLLTRATGHITDFVPQALAGITIVMDRDMLTSIALWGCLVPVISTLPALFRLYTRALNRD